jgi:lysozyme
MDIERLKRTLRRDEGFRAHPYKCSQNKVTIGYGRNLDDVGIDREEAEIMLGNDINELLQSRTIQGLIEGLDHVRQEVILNMAFNMGVPRLITFRKTLAAIGRRDFETAANEMVDSLWFRQVGPRAVRLVKAMRTGEMEA